MTDRDLKKMDRRELIELLITLTKENEALTEQLRKQNALLKSRELKLDKAGSLAEASLALTRIFEDADKAAKLYLENIQNCTDPEPLISKEPPEAQNSGAENAPNTTVKASPASGKASKGSSPKTKKPLFGLLRKKGK